MWSWPWTARHCSERWLFLIVQSSHLSWMSEALAVRAVWGWNSTSASATKSSAADSDDRALFIIGLLAFKVKRDPLFGRDVPIIFIRLEVNARPPGRTKDGRAPRLWRAPLLKK